MTRGQQWKLHWMLLALGLSSRETEAPCGQRGGSRPGSSPSDSPGGWERRAGGQGGGEVMTTDSCARCQPQPSCPMKRVPHPQIQRIGSPSSILESRGSSWMRDGTAQGTWHRSPAIVRPRSGNKNLQLPGWSSCPYLCHTLLNFPCTLNSLPGFCLQAQGATISRYLGDSSSELRKDRVCLCFLHS